MRFRNRIEFVTTTRTTKTTVVPVVVNSARRLRDRWPFLNDPSTPVELKALITERITRWHEYTQLYDQLHDCQSVEECADVSRRLLDAYFDNRQITAEMDYYQQHKKVLGRHPLFRQDSRKEWSHWDSVHAAACARTISGNPEHSG